MRKLGALFRRFRGMFESRQCGDEISAELESHVQMHIDDNLLAGMSPEEARRQALLQLGGMEQSRQAWRERSTLPLLESMLRDLRRVLTVATRQPQRGGCSYRLD